MMTGSTPGSSPTKVVAQPRRRAQSDGKRVHQIDYREVVHAVRRRPQLRARTVALTIRASCPLKYRLGVPSEPVITAFEPGELQS
jgi:hypothetical protein